MTLEYSYNEGHVYLEKKLKNFDKLQGGKTINKDSIWFPKPNTYLTDMRNKLKIAYDVQLKNKKIRNESFFLENEVAEELATKGAFTRPGTNNIKVITEYEKESTPNKPHISSFRMQNRLFRFLGWTSRRFGYQNQYFVTRLGAKLTKFNDHFPGQIGSLSEKELVIRSLMNFGFYCVNDQPNLWDTRFKQRVVVNLLRIVNEYGYITNNELIVTSFALKRENDKSQVLEMIERLHRLHSGKITMINAFNEVNIDPYNASAVNNAYDGPKVLLSLCRQTGLLEQNSRTISDTPFGDLSDLYSKMHKGKSEIKKPRVVNIITEYGKNLLTQEVSKKPIWFDELA